MTNHRRHFICNTILVLAAIGFGCLVVLADNKGCLSSILKFTGHEHCTGATP